MKTLVVRKTLFERIGKLNPKFTISVDTDWFARAKDLKIPTVVIPKVLLHRRIHDTNTSSNADVVNYEILALIKQSIERQRRQKSRQI